MVEVNPESRPVAVIGAGPIGLTLSILLAQRGFKVDVYEKRSFDEFMGPPDNMKVLGTTFTCRGRDTIRMAGLNDVYGVELARTTIHLSDR